MILLKFEKIGSLLVIFQNYLYFAHFFCLKALKENSSEVVQPFLMGCGTKEPKITQLCLAAIQRLMSHEVVSEVRRRQIL